MVERRPVLRHDRMVCFDDDADRFQMRAAGLALRNGRVLVQNVSGDPVSTIPGGRVDQGETTTRTVMREMEEEFGLRVTLGPLAFVFESFFLDHGRRFHEIALYYPILMPELFPYHDVDICHRFREGPVEIEYRWVEATPTALAAVHLAPPELGSLLHRLPDSTQHIVDGRLHAAEWELQK